MTNYFHSLLFSEFDNDPSFTRMIQRVLIFTLVAFVGITVFLSIPFPSELTGWISPIVIFTVTVLTGISYFFSRRGLLWPGKLLIPLAGLAAVIFLAVRADGLHDVAIFGLPLAIVLAGLLAGQKAIPAVAVLSILGGWFIAYCDFAGINQSSFAGYTSGSDVAIITILLILAAASLNALMNILNNTIAKARASEEAQRSANQDLIQLQSVQEKRIAERTRNLELAAEVSRSISQVRDLDAMLQDAAEIIRSRFDLYYVQVYLLDSARSALVLRSGTGSVGATLLARGHQLPLNGASINGRAALEKNPVLVENTFASASFRPNPLLPDTRSELAVPLVMNNQVVGVLDLQTSQVGSLSQDMLPAFDALAGQLAVTIQNAKLLAEAAQANAAMESQARRLVRSSWSEYLDAVHKPESLGFAYTQNEVVPLEAGSTESVEGTLTAPISITGETLGMLAVDIDEAKRTGYNVELINNVARQVSQQIENLRLLESAERYRLESEQAANLTTRAAWEEYRGALENENMGYLYNLNEVKSFSAQEVPLAQKAALTLPIKVGNEIVGKVAVTGLDEDDRESVQLTRSVAERLAERIESLRQFEQTQSALSQTEKLFDASRRLTQATNLQELVAETVHSLNIPAVNRAVLASFNQGPSDAPESITIIANWWNGAGFKPSAVGTSNSTGLSLLTGSEPLFFTDILQDERIDPATLEMLKKQNIRALAILPLFLGARQVGVILLEAEEPYHFKPAETRLFALMAPSITTVWENRRQFERAQKQAAREATLNAINQKIQSATSVDAVLQIAARELGHALGAPRTIAQLSLKDS